MYYQNEEQYIEAIKLAAGSVQYKNLSVKATIIEAASQLYQYYNSRRNIKSLDVAILHIQAYVEMGFAYEEGREIFDKILKAVGMTKEMKFPKKYYVSKKIRLNKTQVRTMIRKWPASPRQTMKITEVVDDIITKVKSRDIGIYYYKCAVTKDMYELVINNDEIFFHDLRRRIFYTFDI